MKSLVKTSLLLALILALVGSITLAAQTTSEQAGAAASETENKAVPSYAQSIAQAPPAKEDDGPPVVPLPSTMPDVPPTPSQFTIVQNGRTVQLEPSDTCLGEKPNPADTCVSGIAAMIKPSVPFVLVDDQGKSNKRWWTMHQQFASTSMGEDEPFILETVSPYIARFGLRQGDKIVKINGAEVAQMSRLEAVQLLHGKPQGDPEDFRKPLTLTIERREGADKMVGDFQVSRTAYWFRLESGQEIGCPDADGKMQSERYQVSIKTPSAKLDVHNIATLVVGACHI